jgi:hypothetical protein
MSKDIEFVEVHLWQPTNIYLWKPRTSSCQDNEPQAEIRTQDFADNKSNNLSNFVYIRSVEILEIARTLK